MTAKDRTIIRCPKNSESPYFSISRALAQDRSLSWEARGLMLYLLSKPDDWVIQVNDLKQNCGRDKVYKLLEELVKARYITRTDQERKPDGTYEPLSYLVYEQPLPEKPYTDNPQTVEPYTVEPILHNTESTEERITEVAPSGAVASKPKRQSKPKPYADVDPKEITVRIEAWTKAFTEAPMGNHYGNETNRKLAAEMVRRSITPEQVEAYTRHLLKQPFYKDKSPTFDYVARNINAWLPKQANILTLEPVAVEEWDVNTFLRTGDSA